MIRGSTLDLQRDREPSRLFDDAASECLRIAQSPITAPPFTMATWFNSDGAANTDALITISDPDNVQRWFLRAGGDAGGDPVVYRVIDTSLVTTTGFTANRWHYACAVEVSATSRKVTIDGGSVGTDVTDLAPAGVDAITIGALTNWGANLWFMSGRIFWPCIWNVVLTDGEIAVLANRSNPTPPWEIRPESIVSQPNMRTLWDPYMKALWTPSGTVPANPPWLWRPRHVSMYVPAAAGLSIPIAMHHYKQLMGAN